MTHLERVIQSNYDISASLARVFQNEKLQNSLAKDFGDHHYIKCGI